MRLSAAATSAAAAASVYLLTHTITAHEAYAFHVVSISSTARTPSAAAVASTSPLPLPLSCRRVVQHITSQHRHGNDAISLINTDQKPRVAAGLYYCSSSSSSMSYAAFSSRPPTARSRASRGGAWSTTSRAIDAISNSGSATRRTRGSSSWPFQRHGQGFVYRERRGTAWPLMGMGSPTESMQNRALGTVVSVFCVRVELSGRSIIRFSNPQL